MTQLEIQKALFEHYTMVIEKCKTMDYNDIINFLIDNNVYHGLCSCAAARLKVDISCENWIRYNYPSDYAIHWTAIPARCYSKAEVIISLQYRINILKKLIDNENIAMPNKPPRLEL